MPEPSDEAAPIPEQALGWCLREVPGAERVLSYERLRGGLAAATHLVRIQRAREPVIEVVLKRFTGERSATWPPVAREAAALAALAGRSTSWGFEVPAAIAHDAEGSACGVPALLLSKVPGRIDVSLTDAGRRIKALGRALALVHGARIPCPPELPAYRVKLERQAEPVPEGAASIDWRSAWRAVETLPEATGALIHGDFHIGNAVFERGTLTGIVDWSLARLGPCAFDVGYCRMDLALTFGIDAAQPFLESYEATRGQRVFGLALWDLAGAVHAFPDPALWLSSWLDAGRTDLNATLVRERLALFVEGALSRL